MPNHTLPKQIGSYKLVKPLVGGQFAGAYSLGLYKDKVGQVYFAKRWSGSSRGVAYKWLYNESQLYQNFSRQNNQAPISIPRFVDLFEDDHSLTLFIEYIKGQHIGDLSTKQKAAIYTQVLRSLSSYTVKDISTQRPPLYWVGVTLVTTVVALFKHLSNYKNILKGFATVVGSAHVVLARRERSLIHRDLNDNNLIIYNGKVYLIDFELAVVADPLIDLAILLLKNNNDPDLIRLIKDDVYIKRILANRIVRQVVTSYMTIFSLYDLCFEDGLHASSLRHLNSL